MLLELFKEYLTYKDNNLYWIKRPINNRIYLNDVAGYQRKNGYKEVSINGKKYPYSRIIWSLVYNKLPTGDIDHIDGNPSNNNIKNLRDVSTRANCQNKKRHRRGKLVGCYYHKASKKYMARIVVDKIQIYLGTYNTEVEAHNAYINKIKELGI